MKTITTRNPAELAAVVTCLGIASAVISQTEEFFTQYYTGLITVQDLVFKIHDATRGIAHVRSTTELLYPVPEHNLQVVIAFRDTDDDTGTFSYTISLELLDPRNPIAY